MIITNNLTVNKFFSLIQRNNIFFINLPLLCKDLLCNLDNKTEIKSLCE